MPYYIAKIRASSKDSSVTMQVRLVEAASMAKALAHVSMAHISIDKATSKELIDYTKDGINVEKAGE